jgi:hypothetical protein
MVIPDWSDRISGHYNKKLEDDTMYQYFWLKELEVMIKWW